jgi:hypothetical protein
MTVSTKAPKIDFSQWTKEEKAEVKTLREIADEVGFPFAARAVSDLPLDENPDGVPGERSGDVVRAIKECPKFAGGIVLDIHPYNSPNGDRIVSTIGKLRRWVLLGHKS